MVRNDDYKLEYTHNMFKLLGLFKGQKSDTKYWTEYYINILGISITTYKGKRVNKWCSINK